MVWAAAWLYRATNDTTYKTTAEKYYTEFKLDDEVPKQFSWDDKRPGVNALLAKLVGSDKYKTQVQKYAAYVRTSAPKSPKGMVYLDQWGPLRHAANAALMALQVRASFNQLIIFKQFIQLGG